MNISKDKMDFLLWKRNHYKDILLRPIIENFDVPRFLYFKVAYDVLNETIEYIQKEDKK